MNEFIAMYEFTKVNLKCNSTDCVYNRYDLSN